MVEVHLPDNPDLRHAAGPIYEYLCSTCSTSSSSRLETGTRKISPLYSNVSRYLRYSPSFIGIAFQAHAASEHVLRRSFGYS